MQPEIVASSVLRAAKSVVFHLQITLLTCFQGSSWTLQAEQMDGDLVSCLKTQTKLLSDGAVMRTLPSH